MLKRAYAKSGRHTGAADNQSTALAAIEELYRREMTANLKALRERRRQTRVEQSLREWAEYWPVGVGLVLSCFAPALRELLVPFGQWAMWTIFPFVAIAERPEIHMGSEVASLLPMVMLYAQFPLEGLLARNALKGQVTPSAVAWQVLFFHFLGATELWLVNGAFLQMFR
jgi:hypothetical protein